MTGDAPAGRSADAASVGMLAALFAALWDRIEAVHADLQRPALGDRVDTDHLPGNLAHFPVGRWLPQCLEAVEQGLGSPFGATLRGALNAVHWSRNPGYTPDRVGQHFFDNYLSGAVVGPGANIGRSLPWGMLVIMGPDTVYEPHRHPPEELYVVLTPGGRWQLDRGEWFDVQPGQVLRHRPGQWHAMATGSRPMLTYGTWLEHHERARIDLESDG